MARKTYSEMADAGVSRILAVLASGQNPDGTEFVASGGVSSWSITATADNAAASVTRAAVAGQSHYITSIAAGFSAAAIKLLTLADGAAVIGNFYVHNRETIVFPLPIKLTANQAAALQLAASGTLGVIGSVTMTGFTA